MAKGFIEGFRAGVRAEKPKRKLSEADVKKLKRLQAKKRAYEESIY